MNYISVSMDYDLVSKNINNGVLKAVVTFERLQLLLVTIISCSASIAIAIH